MVPNALEILDFEQLLLRNGNWVVNITLPMKKKEDNIVLWYDKGTFLVNELHTLTIICNILYSLIM